MRTFRVVLSSLIFFLAPFLWPVNGSAKSIDPEVISLAASVINYFIGKAGELPNDDSTDFVRQHILTTTQNDMFYICPELERWVAGSAALYSQVPYDGVTTFRSVNSGARVIVDLTTIDNGAIREQRLRSLFGGPLTDEQFRKAFVPEYMFVDMIIKRHFISSPQWQVTQITTLKKNEQDHYRADYTTCTLLQQAEQEAKQLKQQWQAPQEFLRQHPDIKEIVNPRQR